MKKWLVVVVLMMLSGGFISAQVISSQYLIFFKVVKIGSHINAQWRTGVDFTCSDVDLYYGTDSNSMTEVYSYPGVCGGPAEEIDYNWIHENPDKGVIYYQLRLGVFGNTRVKTISNPELSNGYIVFPNPVVEKASIEIDNTKNQQFDFEFFDISGRELSLKKSTTTNNLDISKDELDASGLIIFTATNAVTGKIIRGKFSVL
jgi:hypothetical protein